jgi:hypothetical protein
MARCPQFEHFRNATSGRWLRAAHVREVAHDHRGLSHHSRSRHRANTAVFTLINGVMLRSLPISHPDQIFLFGADTSGGSRRGGTAPTGAVNLYSYHWFEQFRERDRSVFEGLTAMASPQVDLRVSVPGSGKRPRRFLGNLVDGDFFHVLGVKRPGRTDAGCGRRPA